MQEGASETGRRRDQRPPHPLLAQRRPAERVATSPADDPAWAKAEPRPRPRTTKLKADPTQFDAIARAESDEGAAVTTGGKLPYFSHGRRHRPGVRGGDLQAAASQPGQLLEPVKSAFGWHVIQVMHYPTDARVGRQAQGATSTRGTLTFADAARDNSDKAEAAKGGDIGWIGKGQLDRELGGRDLRGADRQGQRPAHGRRRRASTCSS